MSVLINFKICDNARECSGIENCPTGALFWDEENNKVGIDNEKCISCKSCVKSCPVGAIRVAIDDEEYLKIKEEIDKDPRKISDLFIERYGAMPINPDVLVEDSNLDKEISIHNKPLLIELFRDDDIMCLRKSIPIKELIPGEDIVFRKIHVNNEDKIKSEYNISEFPCLIFIKNNKIIGKIERYYGDDEKEELICKLKDIKEKI